MLAVSICMFSCFNFRLKWNQVHIFLQFLLTVDMCGNCLVSYQYLVKIFPLPALKALEEKCNQDMLRRKKMEEAIEWYSKVLGFRAKCGEGKTWTLLTFFCLDSLNNAFCNEGMVKFIFNKVDKKNPENDYSFSIRLENDVYKCMIKIFCHYFNCQMFVLFLYYILNPFDNLQYWNATHTLKVSLNWFRIWIKQMAYSSSRELWERNSRMLHSMVFAART